LDIMKAITAMCKHLDKDFLKSLDPHLIAPSKSFNKIGGRGAGAGLETARALSFFVHLDVLEKGDVRVDGKGDIVIGQRGV